MMPIIWRYLLAHYLKVQILCTLAFVAILLITRLDEIAHFATLGPEGRYVLLFTLYQIPYVLPIAIPISALISSILLVQRLSRFQELTALRACGLALRDIIAPILCMAAILSLGSFWMISEISTDSHLKTGLLKNELRSLNPLLILHNKHLLKMKGIFFHPLGPSKMGEEAEDVILSMPGKRQSGIKVMLAKKLKTSPENFQAYGLSLLTSLKKEKDETPTFLIENMRENVTSIEDFAQLLQKKVWSLNNDHLRMPLLLTRIQEEKTLLNTAISSGKPASHQKQIQRSVHRCWGEIIRRISLSLAVLTFTFMGVAFGMSVNRFQTNRKLFAIVGLTAFYLVSYFMAKGYDHVIETSLIFYLLPHLAILFFSWRALRRTTNGLV
jgi:lipopolysaccharide export system permease protein